MNTPRKILDTKMNLLLPRKFCSKLDSFLNTNDQPIQHDQSRIQDKRQFFVLKILKVSHQHMFHLNLQKLRVKLFMKKRFFLLYVEKVNDQIYDRCLGKLTMITNFIVIKINVFHKTNINSSFSRFNS